MGATTAATTDVMTATIAGTTVATTATGTTGTKIGIGPSTIAGARSASTRTTAATRTTGRIEAVQARRKPRNWRGFLLPVFLGDECPTADPVRDRGRCPGAGGAGGALISGYLRGAEPARGYRSVR